MAFLEKIRRAKAYLEEEGRVSLRALRLEFDLDDDQLEGLLEELVKVQRVAARQGDVIAWVGPVGARPAVREPAAQVTSELPPPEALAARLAAEGERRQLTVLFCDLVESTKLASQLDPEDWREVVRSYQRAAAEVIERFGGHVAQYLGDGLLVYFGWPAAHEDDAERALRAGLGIVDVIQEVDRGLEERRGIRLAVRIGIHTGPVVVGEMGGGKQHETLALGDTTNRAARVQAIAAPHTVLVTAETLRLVRGIFVSEDLGLQTLKGLTEPVALHRVLQPSGMRSRLDLAAGSLTPFVGRQQELALVLDRWEQVQEGQGQTVLITGEAGVGKSRLAGVLRERLLEEDHAWLECRCSAYATNSPLHPVIELVEQGLAFQQGESAESKLGKLKAGLGRAGLPLEEALPLFTALLSIPLPDRTAPLELSPELQRRRTLEALAAWTLALGELQPVLLLIEDLQWSDPSSLEFLGLLIEQNPTARVLMVLTARPDFEPPWTQRSHWISLTLNRLTRRQALQMADLLSPERTLPDAMLDSIVTRADGIPLYVEELTKGVLESGLLVEREGRLALEGDVAELAIPATLQDSLMARLDRLSAAKQVAQTAAALGREFSYQLLAAIAESDEPTLRQGLARLVEAQQLFQRGYPPNATYTFKHALIQDTAYASLLRSTRQRLHGRIAELLEKEFPERGAAQPELLAHHYERAGRSEEAISYYQRAGEAAHARSSNAEAIAHLERGVGLTQQLPEGAERCERELALQLSLGKVRIAAQGYASEETRRTWEQARGLCEAGGSSPQLAEALYGLSLFHQVRSELDTALELGEQLLALAPRSGDNAHLLLGYGVTGTSKHWQGRFREALQDLDAALAIYESMRHAASPVTYVMEQAVIASAHSSWTLWYLGYADRSAARAEKAIEQARALTHPYILSLVLFYASVSYVFRREWETAERCASEGIELAERHGFPFAVVASTPVRALALARLSGEDRGAEAAEGIAAAAGAGQLVGAPALLWFLAGIHREQGREADALGAVEAALAISAQGTQRFYEAELLRLKGELLLSRDEAEAETHFCRALDVARSQEARSLELRAATEVARLWQRQGKTKEAREFLAPVYDWFTEGFETRDLRDAKALLVDLS
jgi:class 3 adenylate cyclase/tetratricopeptide (TPR) repeat protein